MGYSISILNSIRANSSDEYRDRIPEATKTNISNIGNALQTYTPLYNEFCEALIHKIGKTLLESKLFKNKLAQFKSGAVLNQQDVEEIFVDMGKAATEYDPNGSNPLGRRSDDNVKVVYHRMNRLNTYELTIGDLDFLRAFKSEATLDTFIAAKINAIYSRAAHDEWVIMRELLGSYDGYVEYSVPHMAGANAEATAKTFVKTLRKAVNDLSFASDKFNKMGVTTWSAPEDLVLYVLGDVVAEIDVEVLAKAFNIGKTDIQTRIVVMDNFGGYGDDGTYAILADKDFFKVFDTLSKMETQRNAQGLFTNYFYHVQQILSLSPFKNAVKFIAVTE